MNVRFKSVFFSFLELNDSLVRDDQMKARLLRKADLTLNKALDMCRATEITLTQMKALHDKVEVHKTITAKASKKNQNKQKEAASRKKSQWPEKTKLTVTDVPTNMNKCPANGQACRKCDKRIILQEYRQHKNKKMRRW